MSVTMKQFHRVRSVGVQWDDLLRDRTDASAYVQRRFQQLYERCEALKRRKLGQHTVIFAFYDDGRPIGLLPLKYSGRRGSRTYRFLADRTIIGELDGIFSEDLSDAQLSACMELLREELHGSKLVLNKLSEKSRLYRTFLDAGEKSAVVCVNIPFPDGYDAYYHALRKSVRQNIRTAYNRMHTDGKEFTFEMICGRPLPSKLKQKLQEVHSVRCAEMGYGRRREQTKLRLLINRVRSRFDSIERGTDCLPNSCCAIVRIDGEVAAYLRGFTTGSTLVVPQLAISSEFARYSPGVLLINETITRLSAEDTIRNLDLSTGDEGYKLSMGGGRYNLWEITVSL